MCMFSSPSAFVTDSSTKGGEKKKKHSLEALIN